jgi:hypothetical protein
MTDSVLDKMTYTGVGFGTYILLLILASFVFWFFGGLFDATIGSGVANFLHGLIQLVLLVMVINTIFLKNSGKESKVFRIKNPF